MSLKEGLLVVGPWWKSQYVSLSPNGRLLFYSQNNKELEMNLNLNEWSFTPSDLSPFTMSFRLLSSPHSTTTTHLSPTLNSTSSPVPPLSPLSSRGGGPSGPLSARGASSPLSSRGPPLGASRGPAPSSPGSARGTSSSSSSSSPGSSRGVAPSPPGSSRGTAPSPPGSSRGTAPSPPGSSSGGWSSSSSSSSSSSPSSPSFSSSSGSSILPASISSQTNPTIFLTFQGAQEMREWCYQLAPFDLVEEEEESHDSVGQDGVVDALSLAPKAHKAGYLFKAGKNLLKQWPKRYVILTQDRIFYYKTPTDPTPLGEIDVKSVTVKLNISDKKLTIVVPSRQYYFAADSGEELKEWSEIILERKERLLGGGLVPKEDPKKFKKTKPKPHNMRSSSRASLSSAGTSPRGDKPSFILQSQEASVPEKVGNPDLPPLANEAKVKCDALDQYFSFASSVERKLKKKTELEEELRQINEDLAISFSKFSTQVLEVHQIEGNDDGEEETSSSQGEEGWVQFTKGKKKPKKPRVRKGENENEGLGSCLLQMAQIYQSESQRYQQQLSSDSKMLAHFTELSGGVSSQQFHKLRSEYEGVIQSYLSASQVLRDLGSKSKAKLELVKSADKNKNEVKGKMLSLATELKFGSENILLQENGSLLHLFGAWGKEWEALLGEVVDAKGELHDKVGRWIATGEGVFANLLGMLSTPEEAGAGDMRKKGYTISGERAVSQRSFSSDRKKKVSNSPVVKRVEELVREEKKFVNLLASIHNIFYPEFKEQNYEWTTGQNEMIEQVFGEKLKGLLEFHQKLLRGLEKVLKGWKSVSTAGNSLPFSLSSLSSLFGEMFSAEVLRPVATYLDFIPSIMDFLDQMGKKESWRSTCRQIQQKQDLEDLPFLFQVPCFYYDTYAFFTSDILDNITEQEPEFPKIYTTHYFIQSFVNFVNQAVGTASHDWSSLSSTIGGFVELPASQYPRYVVKVGGLETRSVVGEKEKAPTNPIGNYAILVNDALVVCMKEQTGLKYIGVYFLSDMEMVVKNEDGLFVTTSGGKLSLSCGAGNALKQWEKQLKRGIKSVAQTIKKFGVPLEVIMRREDTLRVPKFFSECLEVVVKNADSEGIFRLSPMAEDLKDHSLNLDRGFVVDIGKLDEHMACGILKQFFRDLPEALLSCPLADELLSRLDEYYMGEKADTPITEEQLEKSTKVLTEMMLKLPSPNQIILKDLLQALDVVVGRGEENKMGPHNLAIVFTPNVLVGSGPFHPSNVVVFERIVIGREALIKKLGNTPPISSKMPTYTMSLQLLQGSRKRPTDNDEHDDDDDDDDVLVEEGGGGGAELGVVVKEGWLQKKGGGTTRSNWKKRYFVVKYGSLAYFSHPGSAEAIGRVPLVDCLVGQSSSKKANCFAVTTSNRTYLFSASSPAERQEWLNAIQSCLETSF